jgi:DNA modification methylase
VIWHPDMPSEYRNEIVTGDALVLAERIPDQSVDLIFTDPPYDEASLYLYEWLAETAARVLKPGGFCLSMCGGVYLNRIFAAFDKHLTFFWKYELQMSSRACVWRHNGSQGKPIITGTKPILAYSKGVSLPRTGTVGIFIGTGADKRYHVWGQDEAHARYYIDCFTEKGDIVLDPFCGGGTTPAMSRRIEREYIAFEINPVDAATAREHVADAPPVLLDADCEQGVLL